MRARSEGFVDAGILRRLASMVYEALLVVGLVVSLLVFPHLLLGAFAHRLAAPSLLWAHLFVLLLVYFLWFWTHRGQTPAMRAWRIRVLTRGGERLQPAQALCRYLLCWPSLALAGIGIAWALVDRDHLFLHDRLAGTRLVVDDLRQ
jgi:uncharacterized RDD family membrane protein YckC